MQGKFFNSGWEYCEQPLSFDYENIGIDSLDFRRIDIPHDMLIADAENLYKNCIGVYRKKFTIPEDDIGKYISLRFDGVYQDCTVYLNGKSVRSHKYGYSAFDADISDFAEKENEIVVIVRHRSPNSRWYSGAGIYRNVFLNIAEKAHITEDGVYIHTEESGNGFNAKISAEVSDGVPDNSVLKYTVIDMNGREIAGCSSDIGQSAEMFLENVHRWDVSDTYLYTLKTELFCNGNPIDSAVTKFGFRSISFDADKGFFLNGRHVKLDGVCLHHDLGALGTAFNYDAAYRQLSLMKEMGANAVRTSHNMPASEFMDIADELGLLIISEAYDMWGRPKTEFDAARWFDDTCEETVGSWVRRDRNHPSLIMWSIGNEIYDTHEGEYGREEMRRLIKNVNTHDPLKNAFITFGSNYIPWENTRKCAEELDVIGGNYVEHLYDELHERFPEHCIYGSETAARGQSRGIYHFPLEHTCRTYEDMQLSSLENSRSGKGDRTPQNSIIWDRDCGFSAGQFIWTGTDYIGESTPYTTKNSYYGQCDTAGMKKDTYYLYRAAWSDKKVLHLFPYWDFNEGQLIDVCVYTNYPETELFFNGISLGRNKTNFAEGYMSKWQLPYEKGELRAVAYDENGNIASEDIQRSFGDGKKIVLSAERDKIPADGKSLSFIEISTVDENGVFTANARSRMNVEVSGAGRLIGLDSGDSTDYESYKGTSKKLFSGRLMAVIASKQTAGEIHIKVTSEGFEDAELVINAYECDKDSGISCVEENEKSSVCKDIPVRKIEISCDSEHSLTADKNSVHAYCKIYPENATLCDVTWKAVTDSGIISPVVKVTPDEDGRGAEITAVGDGNFRLRCVASNGKPVSEVISDLEFTAEGIGAAVFDPYEFISGSLYSRANGELDEVLQGGVRCLKNGKTVITFDNLDFGDDFSRKAVIPIIRWHRNDEMPVEIFDGVPDDGGELIYSGIFKKDFVWQTYLPQECVLSKKLTGRHTISLTFVCGDEDTNIKGITFEKTVRGYSELDASDAVNVYGDSFTISGGDILDIGNNVTVDYGRIKLDKGASGAEIVGRTRNPKDSVHFIFIGESGEKRFMCEVTQKDVYSVTLAELDCPPGEYDLRVMFLPGTNFDLGSIKIIGK